MILGNSSRFVLFSGQFMRRIKLIPHNASPKIIIITANSLRLLYEKTL